jgi:hypothetical protein
MSPEPYDTMHRLTAAGRYTPASLDRWETVEECCECGALIHTTRTDSEFREWYRQPQRPLCPRCTPQQ